MSNLWIKQFGDYVLSPAAANHSVGMGEAYGAPIDLPGGRMFDPLGTGDAPVKVPYELTASGVLVAANGDALSTAWDEFRAMHGKRAKLYRGDDRWVWARLVSLESQRQVGHIRHLPWRATWQVYDPVWHGTARVITATLDASPKSVSCSNGGNRIVRDVVVTVTAAGSAITQVRVRVANVSDVRWNGNLAVGQTLTINCRNMTVRIGSVDSYTGWEYLSGHRISEWLRLAPGANTVQIYRTGGSAASAVQIVYDDGWA
jgi:hypothetical protein